MSQVPPGPSSRALNTLAMLREPYEATYRWREEYGETYRASSATGAFVVTGDPALVREVWKAPPDTFAPYGAAALAPMLGEQSVLLLHGGPHARRRRLLQPPFHGERMRAYGQVIADVTRRVAGGWSPGQVVRLMDATRAISSEVIVRAVFGVQDDARVRRYLEAVGAWIDRWKPVFILVPALQLDLGVWSPWGRFLAAAAELNRLLDEDIAARRASGERGDDILSLLLDARYEDGGGMEDAAIRDELRTMLFAGHETTMIGLSLAFHYLHRSPGALARTRRLLDDRRGEPLLDVARDPWLDAVARESLRIHPIIPGVFRTLVKDWQLGPYPLQAGTNVLVSVVMIHSHAGLYPEPFTFRPERFLERSFKSWEHIAFGGGARRCIGAALAMFESAVVLATLLGEHTLEALDDKPLVVTRRNLSMAPADAVPLRYLGTR